MFYLLKTVYKEYLNLTKYQQKTVKGDVFCVINKKLNSYKNSYSNCKHLTKLD